MTNRSKQIAAYSNGFNDGNYTGLAVAAAMLEDEFHRIHTTKVNNCDVIGSYLIGMAMLIRERLKAVK